MTPRIEQAARAIALLTVMVVSAEIAARIDDWIRLGIPPLHTPDLNHDLKYQDWFGTRGRPNGRYRRWSLDNYGFRGPDITVAPRPGCTRVMILGASETFGLYESEGKEYAAQLRDSLRAHGCYEVVNAAIAGAGLQGIIRLWENYATSFRPAVVLIYPSPTFYLSVNDPVWKPVPGTAEQPTDVPWRPRLIEQLHNAWTTPAFIQRRRVERWISRDTAGKPASWFFNEPPSDRLEAFMRDLDSLVRSVRANGAQPVLLTHAMKPTVPPLPADHDLMLEWRQFNPRASAEALLGMERLAADRMREYARQHDVCLIDVEQRLSGHRDFFADFVHFTDAGAGAMAALIAKNLVGDSGRPAPCRARSM